MRLSSISLGGFGELRIEIPASAGMTEVNRGNEGMGAGELRNGLHASVQNQGSDFDAEAGFFPCFSGCCAVVGFASVDAASRQRPLVLLLAVSPLDKQDLANVVLDKAECYASRHR